MAHRPPSHEVKPVMVCIDHDERVMAGDPCDDCPSKPGNSENVMRRAQNYEAEWRRREAESHEVQENLLREIAGSLKRLSNSYLAGMSCVVVCVFTALLWNDKIDSRTFSIFVALALSPFYGPSAGAMLREMFGPRGDKNAITGWIVAAGIGSLAAAWFWNHSPA